MSALKEVVLTPAVTTIGDLYVCPASTTANVEKLTVQNTSAHSARAHVHFYDAGGAVTKVLDDLTIPAHSELDVEAAAGHNLEAGDKIRITAETANVLDFLLAVDETAATPLTDDYVGQAGPVATAGNDLNTGAVIIKRAGTVTAVTYVPLTTITGANTNTRKVVLVNKGQAGAGSTIVATIQFDSGVNATGEDEKAVTLSATPSDLAVAAGDVLEWQSTHVGTGIADPGGRFHITVLPS